MSVYYKNDEYFRKLSKKYESEFLKLPYFKKRLIGGFSLNRFESTLGTKEKYLTITLDFELNKDSYRFHRYIDKNIEVEDYEIEVDKLFRKWYKIIKEIIERIECYESEENDNNGEDTKTT